MRFLQGTIKKTKWSKRREKQMVQKIIMHKLKIAIENRLKHKVLVLNITPKKRMAKYENINGSKTKSPKES